MANEPNLDDDEVRDDGIAHQLEVVRDLVFSLEHYLAAMTPTSPALDKARQLLRDVPRYVEDHLYQRD